MGRPASGWLTVELHGWRWLGYPGVVAIAALMVVPAVWSFLRSRRQAPTRSVKAQGSREPSVPGAVLAILAVALFGYGLLEAGTYDWTARLLPVAAAAPGSVLAVVQAFRAIREESAAGELEAPPARELAQLLVIGGYLGAIWLLGYFWASLLYLVGFLWYAARLRPGTVLLYSATTLAALWGLVRAFGLTWPPGTLLR